MEKKPLHAQIYADIRDLIVSGELEPDAMLPSENMLCAKYNTTRRTVREALKHLEQDGVVYAKPKKGYFVQRPALGSFTIESPEFLKDSTSEVKDIKIVSVDDEIQRLLQIAPRRIAVAITRTNLSRGQVYGAEIKYVPYQRGQPSIENEIQYAVFPDPANEKTYSFSYHAQIALCAVLPPREVAELLGCPLGDPLLLIKRLYLKQEGTPIGYSEQYLLQPTGELRGVSGFVQNKQRTILNERNL